MEESKQKYLAIVTLPYGAGSWAADETPEKAAEKVKQIVELDWSSTFTFGPDPVMVPVWDYREAKGWYRNDGGDPKDLDTKQPLPFVKKVDVGPLKNKKRGRR